MLSALIGLTGTQQTPVMIINIQLNNISSKIMIRKGFMKIIGPGILMKEKW
jgi:hypothetical protein